ncbi:MAG: hypothetical protein ACLFV7_13720 [Phycisphaerae bacterium]
MSIDPEQYEKLPARRWFTLAEHSSLYLGVNHLLVVSREYCFERYRRVRYADIQSLQMTRSPLGLGFSVLMAGLLALLAVNWLVLDMSVVSVAVLGTLLGLIWLVWGLDGRSCMVMLRTAVEDIPLRSLAHERAALRALELIEARARRAQDTSPAPEEIPDHAPEAYAANDRIASLDLRQQRAVSPAVYDPGMHAVTLGGTATAGMLCLLLAWTGEKTLTLPVVVICCGIAVLTGLFGGGANRKATIPVSIRTSVRLSIVLCLMLGTTSTLWLMAGSLLEVSLLMRNLFACLAVVAFAVSVPGLVGLTTYRRHYIPPLRPGANTVEASTQETPRESGEETASFPPPPEEA